VKIPIGLVASLEHGESEGIFRACTATIHLGVAQVGERLVAFDAQCPHRAADLTMFGEIIGGSSLRCGVHGHIYDLETGLCSDARDCDPTLEELVLFATEHQRSGLWVEVPDDE
jgi:nitrite reductase/ring-hydroxylating ferredoxin subunit